MRAWYWLRDRYHSSRLWRWGLELVLLLVVVTGMGAFQARAHPRGPLPPLPLQTLEHQPASLAAYAGKPLLVEVWAPWCGVCRFEADNVGRARRWLGEQAEVVSVAAAYGDEAEVHTAMRDQGIDYPVLLAGEDAVRALHVTAFPTVFVVDRQGRIVDSVVGYTTTLGLLLRAWWVG